MKNYCNAVIIFHCIYILMQILVVRGILVGSSIFVVFLVSSQVLLLFYVFKNQWVQFAFNRYFEKISISYSLVFGLMFTIGIAYGGIAFGGGGLVFDIAVMVYVYTAMILASCARDKMVIFLERITIIQILCCIPHFLEYGLGLSSETQLLTRQDFFAQRGSIDLALQAVSIFPASIANVIAYPTKRRSKIFAGVLFLLNIIIGLQSTKRANILDACACIIVIFSVSLFTRKLSKKNVINCLVIGSIVAIVSTIFFAQYRLSLNIIFERFMAVNEDVLAVDRVDESVKYISSASLFDLVMGKGLGSTTDAGGIENIHIHIGLVNAIFKGGVFYIAWIAYVLIHWFIKATRKNQERSDDFVFSISVIVVMLISMLHSPGWNVGFSQLQIWLAFFVLIVSPQSQHSEKINFKTI